MTRRSRHALAGTLVATILTAGFSPMASADAAASNTTSSVPTTTSGAPSSPLCTPAVVTKVRQLVSTELANRVTQLNILVTRVNNATSLTPSDKATLLADLTQTELPGIRALQAQVQVATACLQLRQDAHSMVYDYRVYWVMTPQTDLVVANDAAIHAEGVLSNLQETISTTIQRAGTEGSNVKSAQDAFADYQADIAAAEGLTAGQAATILGESPQDFPDSRLVFMQARTNLANAIRDLHAARNALAQIIHDL